MTKATSATNTQRQFVVCINNDGYAASLECRKIYVSIADEEARRHKLMRVIDESGEDYLYPQKSFIAISLPQTVRRAVLTTV